MIRIRRIISVFAILIVMASCNNQGNKDVDEGKIRPLAYSEGDTLELDQYPVNLASWFEYYGHRLPGFQNNSFHASGVVLHLDSMAQTHSQEPKQIGQALLAWNPDSSCYIDILGERDWTIYPPLSALAQDAGDIDQEVVLGIINPKERRLVMFNGPGTSVETADWLGKDVFILSRTSTDDKSGIWTPEIYLFSLKDSTFTNFTWTRTVPVDSVRSGGDDFPSHWLSRQLFKK